MIATEHTLSLSEFRETAAATIDRLNQTGEVEILTVDGEPRAVLLAPAVYDELAREAQLSRDVAVIRRSIQQFDAGQGKEVNAFFDEVHARLLTMQAEQEEGVAE